MLEESRKRYREVNDQVKKRYINIYEIKNDCELLKLTNGNYRELPYSTEVTLEQIITFVDENQNKHYGARKKIKHRN